MTAPLTSYSLTDLSWPEVAAYLRHDNRLIVPIGSCDQFGPHLPIGAATVIAEALADDLSREFGVLRAPTVHYGINVPGERPYAGTATLREKTLHRMLNDLVAAWEAHGIAEFILITAHIYDPHIEAIATVSVAEARVRVIEALAIDFSAFLDGSPSAQHGGELQTSLLLHLRPESVDMDAAEDYQLARRSLLGGPARNQVTKLPIDSPGSVGRPSLATAEKGAGIYAQMLQKIREKVFIHPTDT